MYRNIMIATDGSDLAKKAELHGIGLAKAVGARITAVTVTIPYTAYMTSDVAVAIDTTVFEERTAAMAKARLEAISHHADSAGIACTTIRSEVEPIYQGIVDTAQAQECDLIVMASHGRRGLSGLILGSETTKVLTHSKIPVLVVR